MLLNFEVDSEGDVSPRPIGLPRRRAAVLAPPSVVWRRRETRWRFYGVLVACAAVMLGGLVALH